jgi:hypothetical protein
MEIIDISGFTTTRETTEECMDEIRFFRLLAGRVDDLIFLGPTPKTSFKGTLDKMIDIEQESLGDPPTFFSEKAD